MNCRPWCAAVVAGFAAGWCVSELRGVAAGGSAAPPPAPPAVAPIPKPAKGAEPFLPKAVITAEHLERAAELEAGFAKNYRTAPAAGEKWFDSRPGKSRVLVTAGHATAQTREGRIKPADKGTGSLAMMLHELCDVPVVVVTRQSPSDPNFYDDNDFKQEVARRLAEHRPVLVLDLHASRPGRPYDVDLGTMNGKSYAGRRDLMELLIRHLRAEDLGNLSQDYFSADGQKTVTRFIAGKGVPAVQVECSATRLTPEGDDLHVHRHAQLLQALVRFIRAVDAGEK